MEAPGEPAFAGHVSGICPQRLLSIAGVAAIALAALLTHPGCDGLFRPSWGSTVWLFSADSTSSLFENTTISAAPALGPDGTVYFGITRSGFWPFPFIAWESGRLYALTPGGRRRWFSETEAGVSGVAVGADGTVYASAGRWLHAFRPDGAELWSFSADTGPVLPPALGADGTVYVATGDGYLHALEPGGAPRWRHALGTGANGPPVILPDGNITVPTTGHLVRTVDRDGRLLWAFRTSGWSARVVAVGNQGTLFVADNDNLLYILRPDGTASRRIRLGDIAGAGVVDPAGNCVFGAAETNTVLCFSETGEQLWQATLEWPSRRAPAAGSDSAFYLVCMNRVHCFEPDGRERWNSRLDDIPGTAPLIRPDGLLLVSDRATLRAVTTPAGGLAASAWPASRGDVHNTGRAAR